MKRDGVFNARNHKRGLKQTPIVMGSGSKRAKRSPITWDELNELYNNSVVMIKECTKIVMFIKNKEITDLIVDKKEVIDTAGLLYRDITEYVKNLKSIHDRHSLSSGKIVNVEDLAVAMEIVEQYSEWAESYNIVVGPNLSKLSATYEYLTGETEND